MELIMRRITTFILLGLGLILPVTAVTLAQANQPPAPDKNALIIPEPPSAWIDGAAELPLELFTADALQAPLSLAADDPADLCEEAPLLIISPSAPADGVSADVSAATESQSDPVLSCMWGNPPRKRGYRTVWYQLIAPISGRISLDTFNSEYDTVLGVYTGECGNLTPVLCDDDSNGFTSETTLGVSEGGVYYIEVADWQPGLPQQAQLNFSAVLQPVQSLWEAVLTKPTSPAISRHAVVSQGSSLYVVGGQSGNAGVPFLSNQLQRLDVWNNVWTSLAPVPGAGYSNTTAAMVNGQIFVPSGYNGNNLGYDGLHWRYDIATNSWQTVKRVPLANGRSFAWSASAVPPQQDRYYLAGGINTTEPLDPQAQVVSDTFVYRPQNNTWITLSKMNAGRYAHTAGWIQDGNLGFCVAGGLGVQQGEGDNPDVTILHRSAECYSESTFGWRFIGDMQIPRYGAGSVVGPDGRWYIFGGLTFLRNVIVPVRQTEVYDPVRNTWSILGPEYDLGKINSLPARAYAAGAMVGNSLWVVGGSIFDEGEQALPLTQKIFLPAHSSYLPAQIGNYDDYLRPDDSFEQARPLTFGVTQERNFRGQLDFYDFFTFDLPSQQRIQIKLEVPDGNNFDLYLYGANKLQWGASTIPFNDQDELIDLVLEPRRYYVMVKRVFPTEKPDQNGVYRITVVN
jgi:N-acetylneuraminic acid mutarotase